LLCLALVGLMAHSLTAATANPPCPGAADCPWNSVSTFPATIAGLQDASDVAVDSTDGDIYVVERELNRVVRFEDGDTITPSKRQVWGARNGTGVRSRGFGEFTMPEGVGVDSAGNVWVTEINGNRLQKFDEDGDFLLALGGTQGSADGEFVFPNDVAVDASGNIYVADTGNHRVQSFAADGAFRWKAGSSGAGAGQFDFSGPSGIATDGSSVWATDGGRVHRFLASDGTLAGTETPTGLAGQLNSVDVLGDDLFVSESGHKVHKLSGGTWTTHTFTGTNRPTGIDVATVGGTDYVFTSDLANPHVERMTTAFGSPTELAMPGSEQLFRPTGVAVDASGNVWALEGDSQEGYHRVLKYDSAGALLARFGANGADGSSGSGLGEFNHPADVAVFGSTVYVADASNQRIQTYDGIGWTSMSAPGGGFDFPAGVAVDGSGNVYVADSSFGASKVWKFDGATWTDLALPGQASGDFANDVAVDSSGNVYVAIGNSSNSRILKRDSGGTWAASPLASHGSTDGLVNYPRSIAVAGTDLFVADTNNDRVQRLSTTGAFETKWGEGEYPQLCRGEVTDPNGVAVSADGTKVYVANRLGFGIQKFVFDGSASVPACDTTPPAVSLSSPAGNATGVSSSPSFSGSANESTTVTVRVLRRAGAALTEVRKLTATASGGSLTVAWSGAPLPDGEYWAKVSQPDAAGNTGHTDIGSANWGASRFTVGAGPSDTTAPIVDLVNPVDNSTTTSKRPAISGTAGNLSTDNDLSFELSKLVNGSYVHVDQGAVSNGFFQVAKPTSGTSFSTQVPIDLSPGTYHLRAYQSDQAGNTNPQDSRSSRLFTVTNPAPATNPPVLKVTAPANGKVTNDPRPTIGGTTDTPGSIKVELKRWNGREYALIGNYTAQSANGQWAARTPQKSIDGLDKLPDGSYNIFAYETNGAGQTSNSPASTFTVDTTPPSKPTIETPKNNSKVGVQEPTFSGKADPNASSTVELELQGYANGKWVVLKSHVVNRNGSSWSFKPSTYRLNNGYFALFVYQRDAAGNTAISDGSQFQVDLDAKTPDNPGTNNDDCQKTLEYGPFHVEGTCLKREGLTWVSKAKLSFNGLQLQPEGGNAKIVLDPFNLRIAAQGKVKVVLGPAHLCLADPTRIISDQCFRTYTVGPFVLYEGSFDWSWQGKVQLPNLPQFGLPAWGGVKLPQLPGLSGFNLPNLSIPGWGSVALPDFGAMKGFEIGKLTLPSLNAPNVTLPENLFGNFKFDLPKLSIGSSGATNILGFPIEGRLGLRFADQGVYIDAGLKLPSLLGGTVGDATLFVGTDGNLLAKNLHLGVANAPLGPIGFRDVSIDFDGPTQLWTGRGIIDLPIPPDGLAVIAGASFQNGQLKNAEAGFEKNFPIGASGLFLYGGSVFFKTVPKRQVGGTIALGLGPQIKGASAVRVDSKITYTFADPGWQSSFRFDGGVKVVQIPLGSGYVEIFEGGLINFGGKIGKDFGGGFKVGASVDGWIQGPQKRFNIYGEGDVQLGDWFKFDGEVNVSHIGVGGCAHIESWGKQVKFGATYKWGGSVNAMWSSCSISAVKAKQATARVAGAKQTVAVPGGEEAYVIGLKGRSGAPEVTLTGPKGERVSTAGHSGLVDKDFLVVHIPEQNLTQIVLHKPAAGGWTIEVADGSTPVDQVLTADSIPTPKVTAKVTGSGPQRTLEYDASDVQAGQKVTFLEEGPKGVEGVIGEVSRGKGKLRFAPIAGPAGARTVNAVVTDDGVPRFTLGKVAGFRASKPPIPKAPRKVSAVRRKGKAADTIAANWTKVAGASTYRVTVVVNGREKLFETKKAALKIPGLFDRSSATVSVAGVNVLGQVGKRKSANVVAPKPKHPPKKKKKRK
jgi:sugar lactone lactonase YvrE